MARSTFGIGDLNAAAPGLSRLTAALLGGDQSYQQGFEGGVGVQSKIAQTLAQIKEHNAVAGLHDAQAAETQLKTKTLAGRPDLFNEQVANGSGVDIPTVNAYRQQLRTGVAPAVPMGPPTDEGQMGVGSFVLPDATRSKISGAIQQFLPLLSNTGDLKPDDLAKAAQLFRESGLSDDIISGKINRNVVGGAQAAVAGKPLFNTSADGAVLDQFGGQLATDNPMARASIGLRGAQAGEASAKAGLAREQAQQAKTGGGAGKPPSGFRWSADGQSLEAIPGGPAIKDPNEGERKAGSLLIRLRGSQQQMLSAIGQTPSSQTPIAAAEFVRKLPWVGEAVSNKMTPEARQQVENAQLDMLDAALTLGTGAAYTREQLQGYTKSYFPQIGDKPGALQDKKVRLANVIRAAEIAAGKAADSAQPINAGAPIPGSPAPVPAPVPNASRVVRVDY